jgi:hypothetical protein
MWPYTPHTFGTNFQFNGNETKTKLWNKEYFVKLFGIFYKSVYINLFN